MPTPLELLRDPGVLASLCLYLALFLWERLRPARPLPPVRGWHVQMACAFVFYLAFTSYVPLLLAPWLAELRLVDASGLAPLWGALAALVPYQLLGYGYHRAMHGSDLLFRTFHQIHHSAERLDVASAFWFGPLDLLGWSLLSTACVTLLGLSAEASASFALISAFLVTFPHANVRTPRWLGYLIQRPEAHARHHERGVHAGNYADLPFVDLAFGTFDNPPGFPASAGYYDGASRALWPMLLGRDVSKPSTATRLTEP